ncbi:hypothetical protein F5X68DRAFT_206679 [Plectosphaerella plurivora]|uniref:Histone deacetylase complex subunit SAP30 Sin3 binding domain-containing protein n=1 Tax=Plectosphaerella plurivora TaxID=936078 RepID=A0A9P8VEC8_9PEZI|nr:hypothetical protein F5X68DRAFT_206679 [Plectosphaerella plurivora]
MPPAKSSTKAGHDDAKTDGAHGKDKNGPSTGASSSKMRRITSTTGGQSRDNTAAALGKAAAANSNANKAANAKEDAPPPGIDWNSFDREMLHAYRREHRLPTSTCYSSSYRQMILSQPGSIGMYSPSMMRKKADRRQSKEQLALSVRKHFNSVGVQENDVIVDFIHKVRSHSIAKADRARRPHLPLDLER